MELQEGLGRIAVALFRCAEVDSRKQWWGRVESPGDVPPFLSGECSVAIWASNLVTFYEALRLSGRSDGRMSTSLMPVVGVTVS